MKKVLLTSALMLTFAFSYANDAVSIKDKIEVKNVTSEEIKVATNVTIKTQDDIVCFGLCCGTHCFPKADCGDCMSPDNIEDTFNDLEAEFCC